MKPRTLQKVCGGGGWWLSVFLVLSFGLSQAEQYQSTAEQVYGQLLQLMYFHL